VDEMNVPKRGLVAATLALLVMASLLLPADLVLAKTKFHFDFNLGVPVAPYYGYGYMYPYLPPRAYYPPVSYHPAYPPCMRIWVPGYYDDVYGNWIFGHYRDECGYYGY
jgi:hypothetical protein